ncbi:MAG: glycosyltransferase family 9 protein [Bdellovibrionia bacterium]
MGLKDIQTKRKLDSYIGIPAMICLQILARGLGYILRRNHRNEPVQTAVVIKFQGMGSLAIAKPALAEFKSRHPNCRVVFWGSAGTCALARLMPEFDEVIELNDRSIIRAFPSLLKSLICIWRQHPDWVFDLEVYSKLSSIFALLTLGRNRAGFALETVSLRRNLHTHLVFFNRHYYLGRAYLTLLELPSNSSKTESPATFAKETLWKFDFKPLEQLNGKPYIVINPHAGGLSLERRWPIESFNSLIQVLLKKYPSHQLVLIGHGQDEVEHQKSLLKHERVINLTHQLTLKELIQCISFADVLISNDTGPLHLGVLCKTPAVALFGPTSSNTYLPERPTIKALTKNLYCSPCVHYWWPSPCNSDNQCMKRIKVDEVVRAVEELMETSATLSMPVNEPFETEKSAYRPGLVYTAMTEEQAD